MYLLVILRFLHCDLYQGCQTRVFTVASHDISQLFFLSQNRVWAWLAHDTSSPQAAGLTALIYMIHTQGYMPMPNPILNLVVFVEWFGRSLIAHMWLPLNLLVLFSPITQLAHPTWNWSSFCFISVLFLLFSLIISALLHSSLELFIRTPHSGSADVQPYGYKRLFCKCQQT